MYSRVEIHNKISSLYGSHGRILLLCDNVLDKCDEWYSLNSDYVSIKTRKQIRDEIQVFIMQEVKIQRGDNPYTFIPAFIWLWIAGQIISLVIQWWLSKNNII